MDHSADATEGRDAPHPSGRSQRGLDWLNFFMADVETAFGPFVAVYLTTKGWSQGAIGSVITVNSAVALASQLPAGWVVDQVRPKRAVVAFCLACVAAGSLLIALFPRYLFVLAGEALHGVTGGAVRIAIAAIGLGLVGHRAYNTRVGRNHRADSFGNAATAAGMGALGQLVSPRAPFFAAVGLCVPAGLALLSIRGREIDYRRARQAQAGNDKAGGDKECGDKAGGDKTGGDKTGGDKADGVPWREMLGNRPLLIFAGCMFLFQFANASVLPLAAEQLVKDHVSKSEIVTSALVIVPQLAAGLIAGWVARRADDWGRKRMLIAAFAALLARTALFAFVIGPWYQVAIQVLGGMTAAVVGILTPLVVADCTRGTGRYNVALGAVGMVAGIGATVSTTATGFVAQDLGFVWGFAALAVVAAIGLGLLASFMPETVGRCHEDSDPGARAGG